MKKITFIAIILIATLTNCTKEKDYTKTYYLKFNNSTPVAAIAFFTDKNDNNILFSNYYVASKTTLNADTVVYNGIYNNKDFDITKISGKGDLTIPYYNNDKSNVVYDLGGSTYITEFQNSNFSGCDSTGTTLCNYMTVEETKKEVDNKLEIIITTTYYITMQQYNSVY